MINQDLFPRTAAMIAANSLGELSLSHLQRPDGPVPLEVSLCHRAARPMCTPDFFCGSFLLHLSVVKRT